MEKGREEERREERETGGGWLNSHFMACGACDGGFEKNIKNLFFLLHFKTSFNNTLNFNKLPQKQKQLLCEAEIVLYSIPNVQHYST